MNVGYWTRQNEEWFVHRRDCIQEALRNDDPSKLELKTAQDWRKALKYELYKQRPFNAEIETLSAAVLTKTM